jgi:glycosyltransferase involved in cell wall biosynthesis
VLADGRLLRRRRTGGATYIRDLRQALAAAGGPVDVTWAIGPPGFPRRGPITSLGNLLLDLAWLHLVLPLRAALGGYAAVHVPFNWGPWWSPRPVVVTVQDLSWERLPHAYPAGFRRYARMSARRTARRAERVITPSLSTAGDLVELYGVSPEKVRVVPIGVSPDTQPPRPREPFLLAAGVLDPRKRIRQLVEAHAIYWRRAVDRGASQPPCRLVVVGDQGPETPAVRAAAGPGCELRGYVPREELLELYRRATLLVYPSEYEGFGLPVLEAMAHGCPVLTADNSSLPEVGGEVALYLTDSTPAGIAADLERALDDREDLARRGAAGRARAAEFTWDRAVAETLAVYEEAIDR